MIILCALPQDRVTRAEACRALNVGNLAGEPAPCHEELALL